MQVKGGAQRELGSGQTFYEGPTMYTRLAVTAGGPHLACTVIQTWATRPP